jgi:hypothetical protein
MITHRNLSECIFIGNNEKAYTEFQFLLTYDLSALRRSDLAVNL